MVSSLVSGKVFAEELSDPLQRSAPPPPSRGLLAVAAAACDYNEGAKKWGILSRHHQNTLLIMQHPVEKN